LDISLRLYGVAWDGSASIFVARTPIASGRAGEAPANATRNTRFVSTFICRPGRLLWCGMLREGRTGSTNQNEGLAQLKASTCSLPALLNTAQQPQEHGATAKEANTPGTTNLAFVLFCAGHRSNLRQGNWKWLARGRWLFTSTGGPTNRQKRPLLNSRGATP
jgi:hypothetical protein